MVDPLLLISTLVLGTALVFLLANLWTTKKFKNLPNGNMGWFIVGESLAFLKPHKSNTMGNFLQEHCSRYGKVFKSHLFGSPAIVSCDLGLNMYILQNEWKLFQASYPKQMHGILGDFSLFFATAENHKKLRNFIISFMTNSRTSPIFHNSVEKLTISMIESWRNSKEVSFYRDIKQFTLNIMLKNLLSIEPEDPIASEVLEDFQLYMKGFISLPINIPGSRYAKGVKARARIAHNVKKIMRGRRQQDYGSIQSDFLDEILSSETKLSDEETVSVVLDILLGGYETTSTLIALILYFLYHSPKSYECFKEEHVSIRKSKEEGKPLDLEDYQKMEFTQFVMYEAMRCGNVVKFLHRKALKDIHYKGYFIPAGWKVLPVFAGSNFDSSLHENPMKFNPWRWVDKDMRQKMTPFGGGPRMCPGAEVAKVETSFFLHHFVLNYSWRIKDDDFPVAHPFVEFSKGLTLQLTPLVQ